tara:strand:- start:246 stop:758 length:513 start_codon:yes stop_codon:yes gene_type:complete
LNTIQEIISEFKDKVFNTSLSMVKDYQYAEDISQEVFMDVYQNLSKFRGDSSLSTWIYKLTINKCLQHIRSKNTLKRKSETVSIKEQILDVPSFDHPGVTLENKELANTLMRAIDLLPEPQRVAFTLHKIERLSHEEISAIMDKSKSSIESLIHRAKQNLRTNLKAYYEG